MNRRGFLKMVGVAAPAIILTPGLLMPIRKILGVAEINFIQSGTGAHSLTMQEALRHADYVLYGDGITDDTAALQAFVNGEKVVFADGMPFGGALRGASYLITDTINITKNLPLSLSDGKLLGNMKGDGAMIHVHNSAIEGLHRHVPVAHGLWLDRDHVPAPFPKRLKT